MATLKTSNELKLVAEPFELREKSKRRFFGLNNGELTFHLLCCRITLVLVVCVRRRPDAAWTVPVAGRYASGENIVGETTTGRSGRRRTDLRLFPHWRLQIVRQPLLQHFRNPLRVSTGAKRLLLECLTHHGIKRFAHFLSCNSAVDAFRAKFATSSHIFQLKDQMLFQI
jgi:hypothetical protein